MRKPIIKGHPSSRPAQTRDRFDRRCALKGDLTVNTTIVPFFTEIIPNHPERTEEAMRANKLDVEKLMWEGLDCWRVADFFEKWFERLRLGFRKAIIPLAHNWSHDASFILQLAGAPQLQSLFLRLPRHDVGPQPPERHRRFQQRGVAVPEDEPRVALQPARRGEPQPA